MNLDITKSVIMKFVFTLRTFGGIDFDVDVLAIGTTAAQIAVDQEISFNLIRINIFIDADELFMHGEIITNKKGQILFFVKICP